MKHCTCKTAAATALSAAGLLGAAAGCQSAATPGDGALALVSAEREDCPGKIVCPITGELICADRCPAGAGAALAAGTRSCCAPRE